MHVFANSVAAAHVCASAGVRQRLSELQHHISEVPRRLSEMPAHLSRAQHHVTLPNLLIAAAVVAGLTLLVMLLQRTLQKQVRQLLWLQYR